MYVECTKCSALSSHKLHTMHMHYTCYSRTYSRTCTGEDALGAAAQSQERRGQERLVESLLVRGGSLPNVRDEVIRPFAVQPG